VGSRQLKKMTRRSESMDRGRGGVTENKPTKAEFLVSFLVDARGGAMTGSRGGELRIVIPPRAAEQPVRVTCRQLRAESVMHPPPMNDGEGLACRVLQLTTATFLSPVLVEINHSAQLSAEREIVVYRSDFGKKWTVHNNCATDTCLNNFLSSSINNVNRNKHLEQRVEIITRSLPNYFALISRPRHVNISLGPQGGRATSQLAPGLQCYFPAKALTKPVTIGLSVCAARSCLLEDLNVQGGAVSPVFTIEPRRRKFHKAVTVSLPVPQPNQTEDTDTVERSVVLLCSMCESGSRAVWENVTASTPLNIHQGTVEFNTVVSAAFWLVNLPTWMVEDSTTMLDKIFRSMTRVPYLAQLSIYWRVDHDGDGDLGDADIRLVLCTEGERINDNCLESREGFKLLNMVTDLVIGDKCEVEMEMKGNLERLVESSPIIFKPFRENRMTVAVRRVQMNFPAAGTLEVSSGDNLLYTSSLLLPLDNKI